MGLIQLLEEEKETIVAEAGDALARMHLPHYEEASMETNRQRLRKLYELAWQSIQMRSLLPMVEFAERLARERFAAGFGLSEVQVVFNVLEEAIWKHVVSDLKPAAYAEALGLVSTVLGAGKETFATTYVTLTSQRKTPSLNLAALFQGT